MNKKEYIKPEVVRVAIDNIFSMQANSMGNPPSDPGMRSGRTKGPDTPFSSPFDDKPFS